MSQVQILPGAPFLSIPSSFQGVLGKMRKSLWIILAVLFVAIVAPYAHADAFVYTYTVTFDPSLYGATFTTKPMQAVTTNTILTAVDLRSYSFSGVLLSRKF
jgi:hypothetical protein